MIHFAVSRPAPKLRHRWGVQLGWAAALICIGFAVLHLFRIDTFVPELDRALPGGQSLASWKAVAIVTAEVFAVPFLLRMRLSPAAQYVSGFFSVLAPLAWLLIAMWTFGSGVSTAQLGEFKTLPSSWLLIIVDAIWLVFAYFTLWALGYDHKPNERQTFVTRFLSKLNK